MLDRQTKNSPGFFSLEENQDRIKEEHKVVSQLYYSYFLIFGETDIPYTNSYVSHLQSRPNL